MVQVRQRHNLTIDQPEVDALDAVLPSQDETTQAVRRRLTTTAEALGTELQVRRSANAVYFWASEG